MMLANDLVKFGQEIAEALAKMRKGSNLEWVTSAVAGWGPKRDGEDPQAIYARLRTLAESGFPGARQGEAREVKRYGKKYTQRPWLWRMPEDVSSIDKWAQTVEAQPSKAGPYAAIEKRLRAIEARLLVLEGAGS